MGLFKKSNDDGWDDDAAVEFHNKAPAAKISEIPASRVGNLYKSSSIPDKPEASDEEVQPELAVPSTDVARDSEPTSVYASQAAPQEVAPAPVEAAPQVVAPTPVEAAPQVVAPAPVEAAPQEVAPTPAETKTVSEPQEDEPMELGEEYVEQNPGETPPEQDRVTLIPVINMKSSVSQIGTLVQSIKEDVEKLKIEREQLEDDLGSLRADIDILEANAPEFDSRLREMVDSLNEEITREFVAGVEAVEIPQYEAANELSGIIEQVATLYADMLPALEKSRDSASGMLETLVPDSNMYMPTKDLVDFSTIAVEKILDFFIQKSDLKKDLEKALKNYDSLSETFKSSKARSDANLKKVNTLAETIHNFTDEFQQLGNNIEDIRWSSFESE